MGLQSSEHNPCLFMGVLVPGEPPISVRIYVDDIIYFSASNKVKQKFEVFYQLLDKLNLWAKWHSSLEQNFL
jgi:hypothetical protein